MQNHPRNNSRNRCAGGNRRRRTGGFTLVEVLTSLFVVGIVAVSVVNLFSATMASDNKAHRMALASALLQNEVEYIRTMSGISLTDPHYTSTPTVSNGITTAQVISTQGTIMPSCKIVMKLNPAFQATYSMQQITGTLSWSYGGTSPYTQTSAICYTMFAIEQKHVGG